MMTQRDVVMKMRTTININDSLLLQAKQTSIERNCTLGEVIDDALRIALAREDAGSEAGDPRIAPLKTYCGKGLQTGVDLSNSAALLEIIES